MIRFENLSVKFRNADTEYTAVDKVNLTINKGEFFGIVGASGAGKSTLVRTVNLLQKPTSGNVYINGKNIVNYSGITLRNLRQNIGMIFQHFNLISNATVYDNIAFALKPLAGLKPCPMQGPQADSRLLPPAPTMLARAPSLLSIFRT